MSLPPSYATVLLVTTEESKSLIIDLRLHRWGKPLLAAMFTLSGVLTLALAALGWQYLSAQKQYQQTTQKLQQDVHHLQNLTSAEINAKLQALSRSEQIVKELQNYLNARGVNVKPVSIEPPAPAGQPTPNAGGPQVRMSKPVPYTGTFVDDTGSLLDAIRKLPIGMPHNGTLTSRFGLRSNPFTGYGEEYHGGLDIRGQIGDPIQATAAGRVTFAGVQNGYGNVVMMSHGFGYETVYGHMSQIQVKQGQKVDAGTVVGLLGNTGRSTGPHLHYEVRRNGERIDPEAFLSLTSSPKGRSR